MTARVRRRSRRPAVHDHEQPHDAWVQIRRPTCRCGGSRAPRAAVCVLPAQLRGRRAEGPRGEPRGGLRHRARQGRQGAGAARPARTRRHHGVPGRRASPPARGKAMPGCSCAWAGGRCHARPSGSWAARGHARQRSTRTSRRTRWGTRSPPISSAAAPTCALSRRSSGTPTSGRPRIYTHVAPERLRAVHSRHHPRA